MTAENPTSSLAAVSAFSCRFNEAAADDRGKPSRWRMAARMRPGFNEAAADDRGKPYAVYQTTILAKFGFNEAAADDRGKPQDSFRVAA